MNTLPRPFRSFIMFNMYHKMFYRLGRPSLCCLPSCSLFRGAALSFHTHPPTAAQAQATLGALINSPLPILDLDD